MPMKKGISVLGIPMWLGQTKYGTNLGPDAIRAAGLVQCLKSIDKNLDDKGNIRVGTVRRDQPRNIKNLRSVAAASEKVAQRVSTIVKQGRFPLLLGGDHSIAIGTLAGIAPHYKNLGVIWFDAHADINTPETTPSGNIHGMPLAIALGLGHSQLVGIGGYRGKIKAANIVMIGVRDLDPGEKELIEQENIKVFSMTDVRHIGIENVVQETLSYLKSLCDGIHLSFDLDGVDPLHAPGVGTRVRSGFSGDEALTAMRLFGESAAITSAEVVELNPILDKESRTSELAINCISQLLGASYRQNSVDEKTQAKDAVCCSV